MPGSNDRPASTSTSSSSPSWSAPSSGRISPFSATTRRSSPTRGPARDPATRAPGSRSSRGTPTSGAGSANVRARPLRAAARHVAARAPALGAALPRLLRERLHAPRPPAAGPRTERRGAAQPRQHAARRRAERRSNERTGSARRSAPSPAATTARTRTAAKDVFARVGKAFGYHQAGFFLYYSPDMLEHERPRRGAALRARLPGSTSAASSCSGSCSPAATATRPASRARSGGSAASSRRTTGCTRGSSRWRASSTSTCRPSTTAGAAARAHVRPPHLGGDGGPQWLVDENVKLQVEGSYDANHEAVANRPSRSGR